MLYSAVKEKGCLRLFKLGSACKYISLHVPLEVNITVTHLLKALEWRWLPGALAPWFCRVGILKPILQGIQDVLPVTSRLSRRGFSSQFVRSFSSQEHRPALLGEGQVWQTPEKLHCTQPQICLAASSVHSHGQLLPLRSEIPSQSVLSKK